MMVKLSREDTKKVIGGVIVEGTLLHPFIRVCDDKTSKVIVGMPSVESAEFAAEKHGVSKEWITPEEYRKRYGKSVYQEIN